MQVVILAGGLGTRLKSVAGFLPKCLVPVAGKPFIEHQFALLAAGGMRDVLLCVGYGGDQVQAHIGEGSRWGLRVRYACEDPASLRGTGGALVNALPLLDEAFMVMYGDSYLPIDYRALALRFLSSRDEALMTVFRNEGAWDASNVRIQGDRVVFYSKSARPGEADYIDYGLSLFRRACIQAYSGALLPLDLARIQADLVQRGAMLAHVAPRRFYEIGKPEGLAELERVLHAAQGGAS